MVAAEVHDAGARGGREGEQLAAAQVMSRSLAVSLRRIQQHACAMVLTPPLPPAVSCITCLFFTL